RCRRPGRQGPTAPGRACATWSGVWGSCASWSRSDYPVLLSDQDRHGVVVEQVGDTGRGEPVGAVGCHGASGEPVDPGAGARGQGQDGVVPTPQVGQGDGQSRGDHHQVRMLGRRPGATVLRCCLREGCRVGPVDGGGTRSEEHTSELQSRFDLVCRLLIEKNTISTYKSWRI